MNILIVFGAALIIFGIVILVVTQFILHKWIKKYNKEWMCDTNEMP